MQLSEEAINRIVGCGFISLVALVLALAVMPMQPPENPVGVFALVVLFLFVNILLFAAVLHPEVRPISILLWLYFAYFLILPGMSQAWRDSYPWDTRLHYGEWNIVLAAFLIFVFALCYTVGHLCAQPRRPKAAVRTNEAARPGEDGIIMLVCCFGVVSALNSIASRGLDFFLQTRFTQGFGAEEDTIGGALLDASRGMIFGALMFVVLLYVRSRRRPWDDQQKIAIVALALAIVPLQTIINFPGGLARFWLFGMAFALLLAFLPPLTWRQRLFGVTSFVVGTYVIFPLAAQTRLSDQYDIQFQVPDLSNYLLSGDLDGLQSLLNVIAYTQEIGFTYGKQFLSLVLFFVPRSVWVDKSFHTGIVTANFAGYDYLNVSCPIVGELYIDFGLVGIVLGALLIGYGAARAEAAYSRSAKLRQPSVARLFHAMIGGFVVILARGPLEGIAAPIVGGLLPYVVTMFSTRLLINVRGQPAARRQVS